jgi:flagellar protein FlaJ
MELKKVHWIGIIFSLVILLSDLIFFRGQEIFFFLIGIGLVVGTLPFIINLVLENSAEKEKDVRFLEFSRNLAESVKSGNPIGQSILNMRNKNFGSLTPHIQKMANQISMGIPMGRALDNFARDIGSITVKRAIRLIREAEEAGGQIDNILDSVSNSIYQIEKLKKERKAAIYGLVIQGYIIFFIFIGIMLVMQFKILPLTADVGSLGGGAGGVVGSAGALGGGGMNPEDLARPFLILLIIQGLFTGLVVGKLAEGSVKSGIKHSFILAVTAFLVSSGAKAFIG